MVVTFVMPARLPQAKPLSTGCMQPGADAPCARRGPCLKAWDGRAAPGHPARDMQHRHGRSPDSRIGAPRRLPGPGEPASSGVLAWSYPLTVAGAAAESLVSQPTAFPFHPLTEG